MYTFPVFCIFYAYKLLCILLWSLFFFNLIQWQYVPNYLIIFYSTFYLFIFFNLFILIGSWLLNNIVVVLPYIHVKQVWVYMCLPSWTPLPPLSPSHPSGSSQCTRPEDTVSCMEPGLQSLRSVSRMVIYMFQCHSLKSSHPRLFPQSPKVCSLYLCLFCCLAHRVIVTIFLNSI